jgi:N-acetylglucosamine kinase-like BadF-type ATPase
MAERPPVLVGVDGGASKTRAAVVAVDGAVLGAAVVRSASAYHRQPEEAAGVVLEAARQALAQAGVSPPVLALGAGLAGADDPAIRARLMDALAGSRLAGTVTIDHDAAAALAGGTALAPGAVIVSGTGSVAFGVDAAGRRARAGGWGPLLDDEGSGYAVGRAVLRAAMRAYDGRGQATALAEMVRRRFGLDTLHALKMAVRELGIDEIAALAPLAMAAAGEGDDVAAGILRRAGQGLAEMVWAVARALGWQAQPFPLVTTGGMFDAGEAVRGPMLAALAASGCGAAVTAPRFPPEVGAALLAARAAGVSTADLVQTLDRGRA